MIVVVLPAHLRALAGVSGDVQLEINGDVTRRSILDALEARYPMLRGTIRDHVAGERRPLLRFFACGEDVTHEPADTPLPPTPRRLGTTVSMTPSGVCSPLPTWAPTSSTHLGCPASRPFGPCARRFRSR